MTGIHFTPFPVLITDRLTLRQLSIDDQQAIFALRSDKEINKYLDREICSTIEEAKSFICKVNDHIKNNKSVYWAITLTKTNTLVGTICLFDFSAEKNSCEIGYEVLTKYQGQGIMKEAAAKVIDYAFQDLHIKKIVAFTHSGNHRSTKLLTGLGFIKSLEADKENPDCNIYTLTPFM